MTIEGAKKNLQLITAFANGETIQYFASDGEWYDHAEPMFAEHRKYRVKPKRVFALYNPNLNQCETNLECFGESRIHKMLSDGWIKVELVKFDK